MNQRIFKFMTLIITILVVNLISMYVSDYYMQYKRAMNPLKFTALGMGIIAIVMYPVFKYINTVVEQFSKKMLKKGKNIFGRLMGIYIAFVLILFALYCIYAKIWFQIDVLKIVWRMIIK